MTAKAMPFRGVASRPIARIPSTGVLYRMRTFAACRRGFATVELGFVALPLLLLLIGVFQFVVLQYTQISLNNALYETASSPETEITALVPDKNGYKTKICAKVMSTGNYCRDNILVEMQPLSSYSTSKQAIAGTIFIGGVAGTPMLLRAAMPVTQFVPFIPRLVTKSSVVFLR